MNQADKQALTLKLASAFADNIKSFLTKPELLNVNALNLKPENAGCCATHNYCDANQLMIEAMQSMGMVFDPSSESQAVMVDNAWFIAKRAGFNPDACVWPR